MIGPSGDNFITINPYIAINLQSPNNHGALQNVKVREALEYAFNKTAVSQVYGGALISKPLDQVIPPGGNVSGYNPYPTPNDNGDPAKAKQLLAQAGYAPGQITLKLPYRTTTVHPQVAQTDQAALKAAGFNVQLIAGDTSEQLLHPVSAEPHCNQDRRVGHCRGGLDTGLAWNRRPFGDRTALRRTRLRTGIDGRRRYNSPTMNALIDKALSASSVADATKVWQDAAKLAMQDAVIVPLGAQKVAVYHSSRVQNCIFNFFNQNCDVTNVWLSGS